MTDVHRPPTLTLRSRTGAAKPTLWPNLNPCHFTVPCFIYKTKTVSFSSKQALSNNVFGVKIGRTTTLRPLFKVINFRRSKFVCTLWPGPVFGMCAAGLATHLTTPVCPVRVARTQTIILQVVYSQQLARSQSPARSAGNCCCRHGAARSRSWTRVEWFTADNAQFPDLSAHSFRDSSTGRSTWWKELLEWDVLHGDLVFQGEWYPLWTSLTTPHRDSRIPRQEGCSTCRDPG